MGKNFKSRWYGRRNGKKLSKRRKSLIVNVLPQISLSIETLRSCNSLLELFPYCQEKIWLEIGFGAGEHIAKQASLNPNIGFIGCEPFINGVANLVSLIDEKALNNILIYNDDVRPLLSFFPDRSINRIFLLFPDPWPKKKHYKRRIISNDSLEQFSRVLEDLGEFRFASDHSEYAAYSAGFFSECPDFCKISEKLFEYKNPPEDWISTRYQHKASKRGKNTIYFQFERHKRL